MASNGLRSPAAMEKWLAVVGIGEDGVAGLGQEARGLIAGAAHVFGGARHLALAQSLIRGAVHPWPAPFDTAARAVLELRGQAVCVLASGDPFLYGVGATLSRHVPPGEMRVVPAPSAFSLAAARLGWALQDVGTVSLHGRPITLILPLLHPGRRVLALTSDGQAPAAIAALLTEAGFGASDFHVLEALGGAEEAVRASRADAVGDAVFHPLNVVAVMVIAGEAARILPRAPGLDDGLFAHDGQITRREVRALTLSALQPRRGELLWDIGAGAGSVAIEWMLADPSLRAVAIEENETRAARIRENAARLGVPGLRIVTGAAPAALDGLPQPDAVFIGGGGTDAGVVPGAIEALPHGGRMVANAVTLAMETLLLDLHRRHGGELTRIALARAAPLGGMTGWRPAMPVTQWRWVKP
ncbi:precorrin-6Y C5,15-methyltransferase (decarboxylating) [Pseudochelatococcus lubricantis]|uniref:Precorrin-6Y C5,15-methyltransferase (Decarboxylating) n=1 Tax=Pseudochelatococcus lubricantis TaxID=1538102 RepID=A0ABX0UYA5_9HYPH|nr:precorrin-6y C5,15-methyltransferase (decarboxylating) subunit CbiE [Pseudochelatococcus lubricantis]NIJ57893.1 precorrin-6Y C5,15-methyltransferase (decarboxylating) [Pseudochelatococcus lubricantis]